MDDIPVIDIGGIMRGDLRQPKETVRQVEAACHDIGFMYIRGHGIAPHTIERLRNSVVQYFGQELDEKLRDRITRENYRGYIPPGFFSPNSGAADADNYEGYKLHSEIAADDPVVADCGLYGPNKWPVGPVQFRSAVLDYWHACDAVAAILLGMLADILEVDRHRFLKLFDKPLTNMTLLHYPPQDAARRGFGIHPHKDTDALTILAPDKVGGLMVRKRGRSQWIDVDAPADALVVNIGDLLELWSGGYFVSTPHKVENRSGKERYSFPYFVVPRFDTLVEPLVSAQPGFQRASVHVGDVSREVWRTNWPDAVAERPEFDLGTLED
jgi:isopenicillin N synthase-like dioxygenase